MLKRASVSEQFSTFVELTDERFSRWVSDGRLIRSMTIALECLHQSSKSVRQVKDEASPNFWTLYWHQRWRQNGEPRQTASIPRGHLAAFVQESCYWAAQKTYQFASDRYTLADYFQMAIARLDTVLNGFSPERGSQLDTYAHVAFKNIIRDTLRQRREINVCSDWQLLLRLSQKRLEDSLRTAGQVKVENSVLAWRCFKAVYEPSNHPTQQLDAIEGDIWPILVREYNQQRQTLTPVPPSSDAKILSQELRRCAAAVRAYLYPPVTSLNVPDSGRDKGEMQDTLVAREEASLLDAMIAAAETATRGQQQRHVDQVLRAALSQLTDEAQQIFSLYYQEGQTQQQIAKALNIKQYTVSRRLSKARESMLKQVAIWSRDTLHISLTSDVLININTVLEEWLQRYYNATES